LESIDRDLENIFELQEEIALTILQKLRAELIGGEADAAQKGLRRTWPRTICIAPHRVGLSAH
jgi:hypothetical protein